MSERHPTWLLRGVTLGLATAASASAEVAPMLQNPPLAAGDTLTGDWFGLRSALVQAGLTLRAELAAEGAELSRDGADGGRQYLDHRFEASATYDTATGLGLPGGTLSAVFQSIRGDDGPSVAGPLQRYSDLAVEHRDQLAELWYKQELFAGALAIKIGKADVGEDFATSAVTAPLLDRAFSFSPSIFTLPTYPDPATGVSVTLAYQGWSAKAGIYDGRGATGTPTGETWLRWPGGGRFSIVELGSGWGAGQSGGFALGAWHHSATFARFDGGESDGTSGYYARLDGLLFSAPGNGGGISGFMEGGLADAEVTRFARQLSAGVVSSDPGGASTASSVGVAASWVRTSRAGGSGCDADELLVEAFLSYRVVTWLTVTPDLQWVRNPGGVAAAPPLWIGVLRGVVTL